MKIIEQDSTYRVHGEFTLSSTDQKVIAFLYLPIIKTDAFSLYETLYSFSLDTSDLSMSYHDSLFAILGMDQVRFLDARNHLEAIGLLETLRKEEKDINGKNSVNYIYKVLPPATPKKFFDDPLLRTALSSFVDQKQYLKLKSRFFINSNDGFQSYKDISSSFRNVYSLCVQDNETVLKDNGLLNLSKAYKKQSNFSFPLLNQKLREESYVGKISQEEKGDILDLCSIYSVTEDEACDLILKNTTTDDVFVFDGFAKDVKMLKRYVPFHKDRDANNYSSDGQNGKLIQLYSTITPKKLLQLYFNAEPAGFMIDFLLKLKKECQIDDSVLNVALDYSLKNTNREFRESYIEKVVYSLSANNITNCYDAMVYLSNHDYEARRAKTGKRSSINHNDDVVEKKDDREKTDMGELAKDLGL